MASGSQENVKGLKGPFKKIWNAVISAAINAKKLGEQDPRRVIHSFKVALAITLVSLFYYFDFLYDGFGVSAMWAVITVVVVFEFSVGATIGRVVNRGFATLLGCALGIGVHCLANLTGEKAEFAILGPSVFLISAVATFARFFPTLKKRYDYAALIFILSFNLITVSAYRDDEVIELAHERLSTVMIGASASVLICISIRPVFAGADLHNLIATNVENLGIFLEGFGHEYFETANNENQRRKASLDGYKTVLNSKATEESLANLAKWEPRHGKFRYRHPWHQYVKIGNNTRECAYRIDALNNYLISKMKTTIEIRQKIQESCTKMSSECGYALKELAEGIKTMTRLPSTNPHMENAKIATENLKSLLQARLWSSETDLLDVIQTTTIASLLIEIVSYTNKIADSVHELASLLEFKIRVETGQEKVNTCPDVEGSHSFGITVE